MATLCSYAQVKSWLKLANDGSQTILTSLLQPATDSIQNYLGRDIFLSSYSRTMNGTGQRSMNLKDTPIATISFLSIDGVQVPAAVNSQSAGFMFDDQIVYLQSVYPISGVAVRGFTNLFTKRFQNVVIQYTAGFTTVPTAIQQAAIDLISYWFRQRDRIGEKTKSLGGQEVASYEIVELPESVKQMLNPYRRHELIR